MSNYEVPKSMSSDFTQKEFNELVEFAEQHAKGWVVSAAQGVLDSWASGEIRREGEIIHWEIPGHLTISGRPELFR